MNRTNILVFFLAGLLPATFAHAQGSDDIQSLSASVNDDGFIVVTGNTDLLAVEFSSLSGSLIPLDGEFPNPSPFQNVIRNEPTQVIIGSVGRENAVRIDGDLVLNIGYSPSSEFDLVGRWGGLDSESAISIPTVPEPDSGWLSAVALMMGLAFRRRRLACS